MTTNTTSLDFKFHFFLVHGLVVFQDKSVPVTSIVHSTSKNITQATLNTMRESLEHQLKQSFEDKNILLVGQVSSISYLGHMSKIDFGGMHKDELKDIGKIDNLRETIDSVKNLLSNIERDLKSGES